MILEKCKSSCGKPSDYDYILEFQEELIFQILHLQLHFLSVRSLNCNHFGADSNFAHFSGVVCSNTLLSNTSVLTDSLLFRGNATCKGSRTPRLLKHFCVPILGPLARTNFWSAPCSLPMLAWAKRRACVKVSLASSFLSGLNSAKLPPYGEVSGVYNHRVHA